MRERDEDELLFRVFNAPLKYDHNNSKSLLMALVLEFTFTSLVYTIQWTNRKRGKKKSLRKIIKLKAKI